MSDRVANAIIILVATIWAANIIAGLFNFQGYEPSESINGIFMAIVGGAFALKHRSDSKKTTIPRGGEDG